MATEEVINKIRAYLKLVSDSGISIEKAFLFGSYLRNEQNEDSDIDIMLVSKDFDDVDHDNKVGLVWKLTRKVDPKIEPYTVGLQKFLNDQISPLLQIVKEEGLVIK